MAAQTRLVFTFFEPAWKRHSNFIPSWFKNLLLQLKLFSHVRVLACYNCTIATMWQILKVNRCFVPTTLLATYQFTCAKAVNINLGYFAFVNVRRNKQYPSVYNSGYFLKVNQACCVTRVIQSRQQKGHGYERSKEKFFHVNYCFVSKKFDGTKQRTGGPVQVSTQTKERINFVST